MTGTVSTTVLRHIEAGLLAAQQTPTGRWRIARPDAEAYARSFSGGGGVTLAQVAAALVKVADGNGPGSEQWTAADAAALEYARGQVPAVEPKTGGSAYDELVGE